MAQKLLPEPPRELAAQYPILFRWLVMLYKRVTDQVQLIWDQIDKTGSSISDLADSNHASLDGLDADDHTQYFNNTRGDSRYYTKTLLDGGQLDNRYYTETETDALLTNKADAGTVTAHIADTNDVHGATGELVGTGDTATTSVAGVMLQAAAVSDLNQTISGSYTQSEVQAISDKIDELLAALRSAGTINT